jgi:hypothetical protein
MNWKTYRDALMFAEDSDSDGDDDEQPKGGDGGKDDEGDVDKLRATYDSQIAELNKKLKEMEEKSSEGNFDSVYTAAAGEVGGLLTRINAEKDAAKALEAIKAALPGLGTKYGQSRFAEAKLQSKLKSAQADRFATQLQFESGGDVNTYRTRLLEAKNEDQMEVIFQKIQIEVAKEGKPKGKPQSNAPRVDRGSGSASRTNVLDEMADIDLSTPEGQKQWEEKRKSFKAKIGASR